MNSFKVLIIVSAMEKKRIQMTVILYIDKFSEKILLAQHKRGPGVGKWDGYGGKVEVGETITKSARRELFEEAHVLAGELEKVGLLEFENVVSEWEIWEVHFFKALKIFGVPIETEEMAPKWFSFDEIPYEEMWEDIEYWIPKFLEGRKFYGEVLFDTNGKMIKPKIRFE